MGINKRAGFLVKLFGFCFLLCASLTIASSFTAYAQNNNSGSASIKAPKNLKKSNANKSDTTNSNSNSESNNEKEDKKDNGNDAKGAEPLKDQSSSRSNQGTPYGAYIPPDRVHWEHPDSKDKSSIKQNPNPNVKPTEKPKVAQVKPVKKTVV